MFYLNRQNEFFNKRKTVKTKRPLVENEKTFSDEAPEKEFVPELQRFVLQQLVITPVALVPVLDAVHVRGEIMHAYALVATLFNHVLVV